MRCAESKFVGILAFAVGLVAAGGPALADDGAQGSQTPKPADAQSHPANAVQSNPVVARPGTSRYAPPAPLNPPSRERMVSSSVAAQLSAAAPRYNPAPPKRIPEDEEPDMRDMDKPRNHIIRLPRYIVREPPPPVLSERAVHTQQGLRDVAIERYLTELDKALNGFRLPLLTPVSLLGGTPAENRAMSMYEDDERLKNMANLNDDVRMIEAGDAAQGAYVKKQVDQTFLREPDFDWQPTGKPAGTGK